MLKYILVSIIISFIFGITLLSNMFINKTNKYKYIAPYLFQLWSLLIFIIFWFFNRSKLKIFEINMLTNWVNIALVLIAIIPTSLIVYLGNKHNTQKLFRLVHFVDGATMEIPQRLLVQNLFVILNVNIIIYKSMTLAILLNSMIWAQFIIVQQIIFNKKLTKKIISDIIASVWFSVWVGIIYSISGNILFPMITHGLERMVSHWVKRNFGNSKVGIAT